MTSQDKIKLRLAEIDDAEKIFLWRNDPWIVSLSTSQKTVTWEQHSAWYLSMLNYDEHQFFIIQNEYDNDIGTVRLDKSDDNSATITIYILKEFTGKGIGPTALNLACEKSFENWNWLQVINADVRSNNFPSLKAFEKALFQIGANPLNKIPNHIRLLRAR